MKARRTNSPNASFPQYLLQRDENQNRSVPTSQWLKRPAHYRAKHPAAVRAFHSVSGRARAYEQVAWRNRIVLYAHFARNYAYDSQGNFLLDF